MRNAECEGLKARVMLEPRYPPSSEALRRAGLGCQGKQGVLRLLILFFRRSALTAAEALCNRSLHQFLNAGVFR
jgi:hypothetical protein